MCDRSGKGNEYAPSPTKALEQSLICAICFEIINKCVTIQPCLHSFCAGCLSQWYRISTTCPTCKQPSRAAAKNHSINNVIEAWLQMNPDRRRMNDDNVDEIGNYKSFSEIDGDDLEQFDIQPEIQLISVCRQCPGRATIRSGQDFVCNNAYTSHHQKKRFRPKINPKSSVDLKFCAKIET
ncbi:hypothetical protein ACOME3_004705 [Neoechinorhynchus agilis]